MLQWAFPIFLIVLAAVAFLGGSMAPSLPSQPIHFSHRQHLDYFQDGRHRQEMVAMHKDLLTKELGDDEVVAGMLKDVEQGACMLCHKDFDQNARDLVKLSRCAECHRAYLSGDFEGREDQRACMGCHNTVSVSPLASIPNMNTCAACHEPPRGSHPKETKLVEFITQKKTIPWTRVCDYLPGDIVFSHERHVELGRVKCQECHGSIERADYPLTLQVKLSMENCMACHGETCRADQQTKLDVTKLNDCAACHK